MSVVTQPTLTASISDNGEKIVLRGYSPDLLEFYRSLPNAKYHPEEQTWTCDVTPGAAWRVFGERPGGWSVSPSAELMEMALMFGGSALQAHVSTTKTHNWTHQFAAYQFAHPLDATMLAMDMGTGKSKVAVDLAVNWGCKMTLIICPKSVLNVWQREFRIHGPDDWRVLVLSKGTVAKKRDEVGRFLGKCSMNHAPAVVVINYESAWREPFAKWVLEANGGESGMLMWDLVILDESHRIKSHTSKVSKFCAKLALRAKRRLCLTGTPLSHSPLDAFGQYLFLDRGLFGTSWWHFKNRFSVNGNPAIPQQVTGYKNQAELQKRFALIAYRCEAKDVLDLPAVQHHERTFQLGAKGRKAYTELENELITEIADGRVTTASNALVRLLRLQQLTSGFLVEDETRVETMVDDGKAKLLLDLIEDIDPHEPVVVFCRFRHDLTRVADVAKILKRCYGELSGKQNDLTADATMPAHIKVLGVQIQSGGVGIDLTRARYAVYYSLGYSLSDHEQSLARLHRPGQTRPVNYYHLIAENTVDRRVYGALRQRKEIIGVVLSGLSKGGEV